MLKMQKSKSKKILAFVISLFMILSLGIPNAVSYAAATKSYNFKNMTYKSAWGTNHSMNGNSVALSFSGQYREIKFNLPETLDMSQCSLVTINASSPNGKIAFKLYDTAGNQAAVKYDFKAGTSDCTFAPNISSKVNSIGIMSMETANVSATVNSVTFTMNSSSTTGTTATGNSSNASNTSSPSTPTLLNTYGSIFGKSGAAVNYNQLNNATTLSAIKKHYNSITLENEMKPDAILGSSSNLISTSEAKSKGYYIPSGYTESTVPALNFNTVDAVLKICYNNGLKLRGHCLVWHSQTPDWFFRTGYNAGGAYVSQAVMNARMEMFIKSYMSHVHSSSYGNVVYAWDVVNEYLHASASGWSKIYGSNLGTRPAFVKSAFQYAYECLNSLGIKNSVSLFYNDFNTYMVTNDIVSLVNYINSDKKICDGVGMQSHLATNYPTVDSYKSTMQTFLNAGFEVQVTELDVTNTSETAQANYVYDLMSAMISLQKAGTKGKITGITWWGLYDSVSWRSSQKPLLFTSLTNGKASYNKAIQAYTNAGLTVGTGSTQTNNIIVTPTPTSAATSVPTSAPTKDSTTLKSWIFGSRNFRYLGRISSSKTVDGLEMFATKAKPMQVIANPVKVNNNRYTYCLALRGKGSTGYRAVKIPVSGKDTIKIVLKSSGFTNRSLLVANPNGRTLGKLKVTRKAYTASCNYTGKAGYLYLYSKLCGINIYSIQVVSSAPFANATTTGSTNTGFTGTMVPTATSVPSPLPTAAPVTTPSTNTTATVPDVSAIANIRYATADKTIGNHNPLISQTYGADPYAMVYGDRVYVYMTNDAYEYDGSGKIASNSYSKINSLRCISSGDMVNWTDHGTIQVGGAKGAATWASNSWAPAAAHKKINGKEKFFLYFANSASSIGVLESDSPTGPFRDPIGKPLITKQTANCSDVTWLFDPAVLVEEDGSAYLYFGGGLPTGKEAAPKTARAVKLGSDMVSLSGTPATIDAPYLFEDSGINKIGNTYYYSYCSNFASRNNAAGQNVPGTGEIIYMTSNNPLGPWQYQGSILKNPGSFFGSGGNNHHCLVNFQGKWYIFYHTQVLQDAKRVTGGYRSTHVDEVTISNGKIQPVKATKTGVSQIKSVDPYITNEAETFSNQGGISVVNKVSSTKEFVVSDIVDGDWTSISGVDFGNTAPAACTFTIANQGNGGSIKICSDKLGGTVLGTVKVTGRTGQYMTITVPVSAITGVHDLYFVYTGSGYTVDSWSFKK